MNYLTDIFFPSFIVYCMLFLVETVTLYLYWYGWDAMRKEAARSFHIFLGFILNFFAFFIMIVPNSWATFQASPVVIAEGTDLARAWAATWNPTWWPVNIHRLIANVVLGGYICGAYAGIRYLSAKTQEERYHYDWMGYVGNFIGVFGLLPLPFAGYWLMREIYQYNQQMGITLMGGFLSWLFILQAMLIGVLVSRVELLFLARDHLSNPRVGDAVSEADHGDVDHSSAVPGCLDDAPFARRQLGRGAEDGRHPPSLVGRVRRHVGQNDRRQSDDSRHIHELHYVLAGRKAGNSRLGEGCQRRSWAPCLSLPLSPSSSSACGGISSLPSFASTISPRRKC